MMKIEKAIEMLKDRMKLSDKNSYAFSDEECKLAKVAIAALEKQINKKPTLNDVEKAIELIAIGKGRFLDRHDIYAAMQDGIEALEKQINSGWIPVSERLPNNCGLGVLLTIENKFQQRKVIQGFTGYMEKGKLEFHTNDKTTNLEIWKVIAWQSLPPAYKEEEKIE